MDLFGICFLGLTTAVGGGILRDVTLGKTPPSAFENPIYIFLGVAVPLICFIPAVRHRLKPGHLVYDRFMLIVDSAGLGMFTVSSVRIAYDAGYGRNLFFVLFLTLLTCTGGGVMRDLFGGDKPIIFMKHIYAAAVLAGAIVCIAVTEFTGNTIGMIFGSATVFILRMLAAKYRWNFPRPEDDD